ncbi:hypothetical protein HII36_08395 [Nonomuraea sp. NN258]|uniref:hypothetical protein n=1 Tax=Nonomuraea antri TaxID=2730852 RepID=UPI00156A7021|nr:hypothetical protein [Nonomuraea antri]NRQ31858.1 hypothetical protein [Nonomuraea antri]
MVSISLRAAVVVGIALGAAVATVALLRADEHSWPTALLGGGAAFGGALTLANNTIAAA